MHWTHYDRNPNFQPATLPNGAIANMDDWMRIQPYLRIGMDAKALKVDDGVWVITGYFYGPVIIETPNGLLVFSSGEHEGDGRVFRDLIRRQVSEKPIIALFYDHAHYAKGAATLLDGDEAMVIAHPDSNRLMHDYGQMANPRIPEMLPALDGRAKIHFGTDHPIDGPDAKFGGVSLELGYESAWIPATRTMADGETINIDGVTIQAFHAITDTEESLTFWLPERSLVIDNVLWPTVPNLYTLRGDRYRDPENWMKALRKIRELQPEIEICVGGGSLPLRGREQVAKATTAVLDAVAFIYDQSIRHINLGVPARELRHHVRIPESLSEHPYVNESYGQCEMWTEAIAVHNQGWFSGYPEDIHALPREVYAQNFIQLAGGAEKVMQAYRDAMKKGEYIWAKDLAANLLRTDTRNADYRQALADVFRKLQQYCPGSIVRHFYAAGALGLEGNEAFTLSSIQTSEWVKDDYLRAVNYLRTRLNPDLAKGIEGVLAFEIDGKTAGLHIRQAVAEFIPGLGKHYRAPDASLRIDGDTFTKYFRGELTPTQMLDKAEATKGAKELLAVFDAVKPLPLYPV